MADVAGLRVLGVTYGGITAIVVLIASFVVMTHPEEGRALDGVTTAAVVEPVNVR